MTDMADRNRTQSPEGESESPVQTRKNPRRGGGDPGSRGRTTIADGVVEKI
ncbi:MAG TPA: Asp23/Gls24 family envelope stress response protein, partial [Streptomyces sp.]|nr:Asp23/Gls24 family envelope stress response protein [Streptomyces sp.]